MGGESHGNIGKNVCSVVGLDDTGAVVLRRRVRRDTLVALVGKLPACIVERRPASLPHHELNALDYGRLWVMLVGTRLNRSKNSIISK